LAEGLKEGAVEIKKQVTSTDNLNEVFGKVGGIENVDFTRHFKDLNVDMNDATKVKEVMQNL
jgi:hypothetical protein